MLVQQTHSFSSNCNAPDLIVVEFLLLRRNLLALVDVLRVVALEGPLLGDGLVTRHLGKTKLLRQAGLTLRPTKAAPRNDLLTCC